MGTNEGSVKPVGYSREACAGRLGVSLRTVDALLADGKLKSIRIGKRRLVSESAIQEYVAKNEKF